MMLVSLLCTMAVGIVWFRSVRGHADSFKLPWIGVDYRFDSAGDKLWVHTIHKSSEGIFDNAPLVPFKQVLGYTLIIPALWVAIWIRGKIPRPTRPPRDRKATRLPKL
jgi:hypothetical protein